MDPMIKNSFFTILIYWNDNRIHLGLTKKLIFFILFPPLVILITSQVLSVEDSVSTVRFIDYGNTEQKTFKEMFRLIYTHFLQFA